MSDLRNLQGYWDVTRYQGTYSYDKLGKMISKINIQANGLVILMNENIDLKILENDYIRVLKNKNKKADEIVVIYPNGKVYNLKQS